MIKNQIKEGKDSIGIEFGSTRTKTILVGEDLKAALQALPSI